MAGRMEGKRALVTGGSRGIGEAIATAFAREGARVAIASRKAEGVAAAVERIEGEVPGAVVGRACHIGHPEQIGELVGWAEESIGPLDVLVNNAATNPHFGPMIEIDAGAWDKTFEVNLRGYFETTRQVVRRMIEHGSGGSVISIASVAGITAAPFQGVYGMTKAAVISMTKTLAVELGSHGIRVHAIAPGLVDTRLAAAITSVPEFSATFTERSALGRVGRPDEIAGMAVYLASDESSFASGHTYCVDGGLTVT